jgi:hypothetical protein
MYINVRVEHNSNIDKTNELHNNSLNNRRTSSKYPNTFIHHNSYLLNNEYMISIYTYSHIHMRPLYYYVDPNTYIFIDYMYIYPYICPPLGSYHIYLTTYIPPLGHNKAKLDIPMFDGQVKFEVLNR